MTGPTPPWLLYGAYGFTGDLIARHAVERGHRPILAGRDGERTRALAGELGLEHRVFGLSDPVALREGVRGVAAVLHTAGPFHATWSAMTGACLAEGAHYLDITGEIEVLEGVQSRNHEVERAGLHFVPAVGFDVVPTDCAAALAVEAFATVSDAAPTELDLAFHTTGGPSRGTARTALGRMDRSSAVRRDGHIVPVPLGSIRRTIPFSDKPRSGVAIPWGDVSTAWRSTGIPDIQVFAVLPPKVVRMGKVVRPLMRIPGVRALARRAVDALVEGPDADELARGHSRVWAEVRRGSDAARVEIVTPNGYVLTARAAVAAVERILSGRVDVDPGVHTPSRAFGAGFVLGLEGVERVV